METYSLTGMLPKHLRISYSVLMSKDTKMDYVTATTVALKMAMQKVRASWRTNVTSRLRKLMKSSEPSEI